jgi:predicted porin
MKKSLLAVAAMTAFAGAAQAQSSVTVYGILDVGFVGSEYRGTSSTANTSNVGTGVGGTAATNGGSAGFGQSAESTSRLGLKGTEDLGGGTSAIFTIETAVDPNGGSNNSATSAISPGLFGQFNRQAFVGLKKNGLATASIGTQYTPMFDVQSTTDAAGNNNLVGNAVYSGSLQSTTGTYNNGLSPVTSVSGTGVSLNEVSAAYVTRASNAIKVQSDRIAGFQGELFYAQANQNQSNYTTGNGNNTNTMFGLNADYVWKKLQVVAAYQSIRAYNGNATAPTAAGMTVSTAIAGSFGVNNSDSQTYAAATYDFGIFKGYAQYVTRKAFSVADNNLGTSRSAYQLGARAVLTPAVQVYATYGLGKSSYFQAGTAYANFRTAQLGADYYLSKRTNLYAAYGSFNQSSPNSASVPTISSVSGMNYALGVRHTF